ncbi:MAG: NUDIX domain-containing protein [Candidatus Cloacimonetes bacterium]|nr:NUDIX domain-containing protein [Candidatus Cloacimonadota bacterium]
MYPEPTVGAVILNNQNEILLVKSHKWDNNYVIPGGHIELGEKIEDALRREVKEETGLEIYDIKFLGLQQCIFDKDFEKKKHFIFIDFVCKSNDDKVVLNEEHEDYIWIKIDEIDDLPMENFTGKLLKEYRKKEKSEYMEGILYNYY